MYEYDNGGNIKRKISRNINSGTETISNYGYNTKWEDLLVSYKGQSITYDNIGNPLSYYNGTRYTFTWEEGRQLASVVKGSNTYTYKYNQDGIRIEKNIGTLKYEYTLNGTQIARETVTNGETLVKDSYFYYDASGLISSAKVILYSGTTSTQYNLVFDTNIQGDVVGIYLANGICIATFDYDAWGMFMNTFHATDETLLTLAYETPFRYRGYQYDYETGLYYLNSRYYDAKIGRFISSDSVLGMNSDLTTYNLFSYCGNNPVCRYDTSGTVWKPLYDLLHAGNDFFASIGIDTAQVGGFFLMMKPDGNGVYHTSFICWQMLAGYNHFYDVVFDLATSMVSAEFAFQCNGVGYTIWAWKGDYINLGAGAELGIYLGDSGQRYVLPRLAMKMSMMVYYKDELIIAHFPENKQWWITSFNPDYQKVDAKDLRAYILVYFNNRDMYEAFKKIYGINDPRVFCYDKLQTALITL